MCVVCVLCLIVVPLPPGKNPFAVKVNNNNNNVMMFHLKIKAYSHITSSFFETVY
jgi:hypothetical protein